MNIRTKKQDLTLWDKIVLIINIYIDSNRTMASLLPLVRFLNNKELIQWETSTPNKLIKMSIINRVQYAYNKLHS